MGIVNSKMYIRSGVIKELIIFLWTFMSFKQHQLTKLIFQTLRKKFYYKKTEAVFLVMCDPSMNELWVT